MGSKINVHDMPKCCILTLFRPLAKAAAGADKLLSYNLIFAGIFYAFVMIDLAVAPPHTGPKTPYFTSIISFLIDFGTQTSALL